MSTREDTLSTPAVALEIGGATVEPGTREDVEARLERLASGAWISLPMVVLHGRRPGPRVWISAAVHGDEINGVEIIRRLLNRLRAPELSGTVIAIPVVNVLGFMHGVRYFPDRRDLNRVFPGSPRGSLASRLANLLMREVVERCDYGIDLHTGSDHRANLPQIRADLEDGETWRCAEAFGAEVMIHSRSRKGSLRLAAMEAGARVLLYEGGEANRFDDRTVDAGVEGVLRVLRELGMIELQVGGPRRAPRLSRRTRWVRAARGGLLRLEVDLGDLVERRQVLGYVADIFGRKNLAVRAPTDGLVIGEERHPMINQGDAIVHIAELVELVPSGGEQPASAT